MADTSERGYTTLLEAAENHGADSDPDMEAGDLGLVVRACWLLLTPAQREQVLSDCEDILEWGGFA